jgi:hypothetical protein
VWGYKDPAGVTLHTTRHSAVTAMLEAGAQIEAARRAVGHSKKTMTMRYSHASDKAADRALEALDVFAVGLEPLSAELSKDSGSGAANAAYEARGGAEKESKTLGKRRKVG